MEADRGGNANSGCPPGHCKQPNLPGGSDVDAKGWVTAICVGTVGWFLLTGCGASNQKAAPDRAGAARPSMPARLSREARGAKVFAASCASCHGAKAQGTASAPPLKTANLLHRFGSEAKLREFIAHNMPASNPGSLSAAQASDVSWYVWKLAGGR
ncbi:MAG: cytochrome c [Firmicutes bacterium]|nr:cytochrome c [Bacillota bacterium]